MKIGLLSLLAFATLIPLCASTAKVSMCLYCASQDFFDNALHFVERQVINGKTRTKYIADRDCNSTSQHMKEIECMGRCFTMQADYSVSGALVTAEVRSCEVLHFNEDEREAYNENRCYERTFKGKQETFCFCDDEQYCNKEIVEKNGQKMFPDSSVDFDSSEEVVKNVELEEVDDKADMKETDNTMQEAQKVLQAIVPEAFTKRADAITQKGDKTANSADGTIYSLKLVLIVIVGFFVI